MSNDPIHFFVSLCDRDECEAVLTLRIITLHRGRSVDVRVNLADAFYNF